MITRGIVAFGFLVGVLLAAPASPCSVAGIAPPAALVGEAEAIVLAQADGLSAKPGVDGVMAASPTQIRFTVIRVLKGTPPRPMIEFNGVLEDHDDPNDEPVPYTFVRRGGRHGNCFALGYRLGAQYLLLLKRAEHPAYAQRSQLTPYWAPLAATNEQVFGQADRWLRWVEQELTKPK